MQIHDFLNFHHSHANITRFEVELILCHVLQVERSHIYTNSEQDLNDEQQLIIYDLLQRRMQGEPLAYILGNCEFWGLKLTINPLVLVPRQDTELLVEIALQILDKQQTLAIADLGTGSGAIAVALAHECNKWQIYAVDNNAAALQIAQCNVQDLKLSNVVLCHGSWCEALPPQKIAAIISNPPYIALDDPYVQEQVRKFEPHRALFATDDGYSDLQTIIEQAPRYLSVDGWLMLEHGFAQAARVREMMVANGFVAVKTYQDLSGHGRVTVGKMY